MARKATSAKRYAQAIFEIAQTKGALDKWLDDLQIVAGALADPDLGALLDNRKMPLEDKRFLLTQALEGVSPEALNLAVLLLAKGRLKVLPGAIAAEYRNKLDAHRGIERVEVVTAVPLDPQYLQRISSELATVVKKQIRLAHRVDPALVGGMVIKIGDRLVDGSVKTRLESLHRSLVEAAAPA